MPRNVRKLYFLDDRKNLVSSFHAKSFIYKKKFEGRFIEYFGKVINPTVKVKDILEEINSTENVIKEENFDELKKMYGLDKTFYFNFKDKKIPLTIESEFLNFAPSLWAGDKRSKEELAQGAVKGQKKYMIFTAIILKKNMFIHWLMSFAPV